MTCVAPGWGTGPYGTSPWAGSFDATPGGPIPSVAPFDIYCVGPCGPMSVLLTFDEVDSFGTAGQLVVDAAQDQEFRSGGADPTTEAYVTITTTVPDQFTLDFTFKSDSLPPTFSNLVNSHIFIGVTDAAGPCVGLFFSQVGIAYAGGVHFDGSNNMVLDSSFQPLPDSQTLITQGEYYSVRIATSLELNAVYIYVTKTTDLPIMGHQLRYIMPLITADELATPPTDRTLIAVRGTLGSPSILAMDSICLSSEFIIPNIPPVADAGLDQAARICSIIQLDGTKSFDPEGVPVTYRWRLIDAPITSGFLFNGNNGGTVPLAVPTGFTNKFYSTELATLDGVDPLVSGEVLLVAGVPYLVTGTGTDGGGFFVTIEGFELPDNLTTVTFKYVRQRGISGPTTSKPTFFPDQPGVYRFDLMVSDGALTSQPSVMIVNVTESPIPRGCIPDLRFVWGYLSDFWNLVDDRGRIETFWSAAAQVAASELLTLWQIDYSKSLRDIQRTFQRRWLHYDPLIKETLPDLSEVSSVYSGVTSNSLGTSTLPVSGGTLIVSSPVLTSDITITIAGVNPVDVTSVAAQINGALRAVDERFSAFVFQDVAATEWFIRIVGALPFTITGGTLTTSVFQDGSKNGLLSGSSGAAVGPYSYKVEFSLDGISIGSGDYLVVDGVAYRIRSVVSGTSDTYADQRIVTLDPLPLVLGTTWYIGSRALSLSTNFYKELVSGGDSLVLEILDKNTEVSILLSGAVLGVSATRNEVVFNSESVDEFLVQPDRFEVSIFGVRRKKYVPVNELVEDIPYLQEHIQNTDDTSILRRNIDFYLEKDVRGSRAIRFETNTTPDPDVWEYGDPPDILWAETTYLSNLTTIEQNFGIPAEFTLDDLSSLSTDVDYLSSVRGLWYSYIKGPTLYNLRAGTQILLGLPFAEEAGIITEIRTDYSTTQGRILIQDSANKEIIRSYTYPLPLELEINPDTGSSYAVGDSVHQFAPLVTGSEVLDYVKDPKWFQGILNQGLFFEVEKFFKFLVRVDSAAFNLSALLFVKSFILRIKPTYTYPLFVVLAKVDESEVSTTDDVEYVGNLYLWDGACFQFNGTTTRGVANMWDEPDPSGGGSQSFLDTDSDPSTAAPTFPTAQYVQWGLDRNLLCPEDYILAFASVTYGAPTIPTLDSIYSWDSEVFTGTDTYIFEDSDIVMVPTGSTGVTLYSDITVSTPATLTDVEIVFDGYFQGLPIQYTIEILVNSVVQDSFNITPPEGHSSQQFTTSIAVVATDVIRVRLIHGESSDIPSLWETVMVKLGIATAWALDTALPAGTYTVYRDL